MQVIADASAVAALRSEWIGVVRMRDRMKLLVSATFAGGALTAPALAKVVYNLPLLLAFDVLKQVLSEARREGRFTCPRDQLGNLMDSAKDALPWIDWDSLRAGVTRRNEIAHDGKLFDSKDCIQDIGNVEAQLVAWGVVDAMGGAD